MTDYLEEHLERAEALLEQVRKMERSTTELPQKRGENARDLPEKGAENRTVADDYKKVDGLYAAVDRTEETVDNRGDAVDNQEEEPQMSVDSNEHMVDNQKLLPTVLDAAEREDGKDEPSNAEKAEKNSVPLSDQLEELDRAVSSLTAVIPENTARNRFPESRTGSRRTAGYPDVSAISDGARSAESGVESSVPLTGGVMSWAEQTDRVFRRDSRRYDGGFSLY